jgi:hypothetical protein
VVTTTGASAPIFKGESNATVKLRRSASGHS